LATSCTWQAWRVPSPGRTPRALYGYHARMLIDFLLKPRWHKLPLLGLFLAAGVQGQEVAPPIDLVYVPRGCFQMGSSTGERHERPVHEVCVEDFELGKFEITQAQWRSVMDANPSKFSGCGDSCPVEQVSWDEAQQFIG